MFANAQTPADIPQVFEPSPLTDVEKSEQFSSKLLGNLYNSCNESADNQLKAADAVMERIYNIGYDNKRRKKLNPNNVIYKIGNNLYTLTKKIFAKKLTADDCRETVEDINNDLLDSKILID